MSNALHRTHGLATLAILQAYEAAQAKMTGAQIASVDRSLDDGTGRLALLVTNDGQTVHVELALAPNNAKGFDKAILRLEGPVTAAGMPSECVEVVERGATN
jgi:hypothetical protein